MKKLLLYTVFFFCTAVGYAQNLVPNFSFEQYNTCPNAQDQAQYSTGWTKVSDVISTPDYYNSCDLTGAYGVPHSGTFYQADHRNCGAFMGLVTWNSNNDREQIGIQLTQPLIIGQKYFLSFYTVMSGYNDGTFYYESPSNNIGMRLSTVLNTSSNPAPINNFAHLRSVSVINDTVNWLRITGSIVADSAYSYLMLGNFYDNANTDTTTLNCGTCLNNFSYYLIDDVCISTDSLLCNGGIDAIPCTVSVPELSSNNEITLFPNPTVDVVTISFPNNQSDKISLTDVVGGIIYSENIKGRTTITLNMNSYPSGIYYLKIINQKGTQTISKKIIKL